MSQSDSKSSLPDAVKSGDSDAENYDEMPPLEQIREEMITGPVHNKNIVIPGLDDGGDACKKETEEGKKDDSSSDDGEEGKDDDAKDGWIDILNNGDLRKKVLIPGQPGTRPMRGSCVSIKLTTRVHNEDRGDEDVDVSGEGLVPGETFSQLNVVIGDNDLHQGLDLLLPLMELGETCRALVKPRFAYGTLGNSAIGVGPSATLDLELQLIEVLDQSDNMYGEEDEEKVKEICSRVPLQERFRFGAYKKNRGNFWFTRGDFSIAIQCYRGALKYLDASEEELKQLDEYEASKKKSDSPTDFNQEQLDHFALINDLIENRSQTFNNLAATQIKLSAFDQALRSIEDALLLRPQNTKALFRRAKVQLELGKLDEAIDDLKKANKLDPDSEAIRLELDRCNKMLAKQLYEQKQMYKRMMNNPSSGGAKSETSSAQVRANKTDPKSKTDDSIENKNKTKHSSAETASSADASTTTTSVPWYLSRVTKMAVVPLIVGTLVTLAVPWWLSYK